MTNLYFFKYRTDFENKRQISAEQRLVKRSVIWVINLFAGEGLLKKSGMTLNTDGTVSFYSS